MLTFEHVSKVYDGNRIAVADFNLEVEAGEFIVLIGPSGCGKTTTLKMVNRLIEPTSGAIYLNGKDIREQNPVALRRHIGYVIQQIALFPNMTIAQNVDVVPRLLGWPAERRRQRVCELLELVGMDPDDYADRYPSELSGGQQQRIGVLRALAAEPPLILMDEPFGALDPITRENLQEELKALQAKLHKTILFVTHDMDEALKIADRIVVMKDGYIVQVAAPEELLRHPANEFVASFIGKERLAPGLELRTVEQVMIGEPVTVRPHTGVAEGVATMRRKKVDTLLVTDESGRLLGAVSIEELNRNYQRAHQVQDLMARDVPVVFEGTPAREAFDLITRERLEYLPVIDKEGRLKGLVTRTSMVNALASVVWGDEASA
ncbi:betaine/proline/choline family ABC transporter ATP-binding protein [Neomoorella thermoacetica]|uniref:Quaternary amine transport ATP-binding protein n=2 Tax=Neomoorella thermoacetica TaxID=1525 RepID=A0A1J5NV90_NEOTH|nr:betaine/proline/choline family ABC transporter ATP-binding protein [Moorella thermoacetica]AKX94488.1 glycine betaine/carnitine/choline transport ATP-binding protein OpuCA [Moorella thermoacetica]AKX97124.1 glycine betaine/carnitine/choline transport ATP-binding protein OpuCA [Moorella thermoacetica]OIQ08388.1 glycine betaine/carnitine/choline transport ATP-binding protein OpuCA [Moorella thermoacetica]OIQ55171.1 glycine betaine/carnitine/choline transport ATP-binding protein OpuCA [Moorella